MRFSNPTRLIPSTESQLKTMAHLGKCIEADDDPTENIALLEKELGDGARNVMREALQAKSVEHGRDLLMRAAALGNQRWFRALVREMVERVSVTSMVQVETFGLFTC